MKGPLLGFLLTVSLGLASAFVPAPVGSRPAAAARRHVQPGHDEPERPVRLPGSLLPAFLVALGLLAPPATPPAMDHGTMVVAISAPRASAVSGKEGLEAINTFLRGVKSVREDLGSDSKFDALSRVQKVFDVESVQAAVSSTLETAQIADQTSWVEKRKVIDKVLRKVCGG
jgi:hypothetical protein